jgi:hypothetical protein
MRELYNFLSSLPPREYILVAVLIGMLLTNDLTPDEQRALGGFFSIIGQVLWVNSSQTELLISRDEYNQLVNMKREIERIKRFCDNVIV